MRWLFLIFVVFMLLLGACTTTPPETQQVVLPAAPQGQSAEATEGPAAPPTDAPYPAAERPYPAAPEAPQAAVEGEPAPAVPDEPAYPAPSLLAQGRVEFVTDDGLTLVGTFDAPDTPAPWPAVILLHMLGSNRTAWDALLPQFTAAGYAVLALDLRGHGDTGGETDWDLAANDLEFIAQVLADQPEIVPTRMAIAGASIGANLALKTGAAVPALRTVVLLSPGLDYRGVTTEDSLEVYGARPLLIAASSEDGYSFQSSGTLIEQATGPIAFQRYEGAGHGTAMFNAEAGLIDLILDHLDQFMN